MAFTRRWILVVLAAFLFLLSLLHTRSVTNDSHIQQRPSSGSAKAKDKKPKTWTAPEPELDPVPPWFQRYEAKYPLPEASMVPIPDPKPGSVPRIQAQFPAEEDPAKKKVREQRLATVKETFLRSWKAYKQYGWKADEIGPLQGDIKTTFGGWGATLVDSLDTLWIMGLKDEFEEAVVAAGEIDFSDTKVTNLNVFETTIRYLGGFLGAYDLTGREYPILLEKAVEVGDLLYVAFDTPNHFPVLRWDWMYARDGATQQASFSNVVAELGSLTVEFTRLTQLTKDPKFYDAIQRIMAFFEANQDKTKIPGLWPLAVDAMTPSFPKDNRFTFGGMADSLYEYLPKQHLMLGGGSDAYKKMYEKAIDVATRMLFFRPRTKDGDDVLISGSLLAGSERRSATLQAEGQHLTCFAGGMVALGAKIFNRPDDLEVGRKLTEGCIWAYRAMPTGIMPEIFRAVPCREGATSCKWNPRDWFPDKTDLTDEQIASKAEQSNLVPGIMSMTDKTYILRFVLARPYFRDLC